MQPSLVVDHQDVMNAFLQHRLRHLGERRVGQDENDVFGHHVADGPVRDFIDGPSHGDVLPRLRVRVEVHADILEDATLRGLRLLQLAVHDVAR